MAVLVRLRFLDVPLSVDEGGYAAVARFWASGSHLYRDVWVDRPQGLLLLYRGAFDLFDYPTIYDGYDAIESVAAQGWVKNH